MDKVSVKTAEHYVWGGVCDGWHLVDRPELSVVQERMPPGAADVLHVHRSARQFFFVLGGRAVLEVESVAHDLAPGEGLEVAPGVPHQILNRGAVDLEFVVVSQPHSHGDRVPL